MDLQGRVMVSIAATEKLMRAWSGCPVTVVIHGVDHADIHAVGVRVSAFMHDGEWNLSADLDADSYAYGMPRVFSKTSPGCPECEKLESVETLRIDRGY